MKKTTLLALLSSLIVAILASCGSTAARQAAVDAAKTTPVVVPAPVPAPVPIVTPPAPIPAPAACQPAAQVAWADKAIAASTGDEPTQPVVLVSQLEKQVGQIEQLDLVISAPEGITSSWSQQTLWPAADELLHATLNVQFEVARAVMPDLYTVWLTWTDPSMDHACMVRTAPLIINVG
ncbi:hypothetical protein [Deinococcus yunweiensis]|uniref:hypothetical protein n=1 Tax=Deinococcus yunweiensis TaxID=367282 RepID=UPI00398EC5E1